MIGRRLRRLLCATWGHDLRGVTLPPGWWWHTCAMCQQRIRVYGGAE